MKKTKNALLHSVIALLLCISMFIGSTFAWFSDQISSGKNIITAGNLDLEMYWTDDLNSGEWHNVEKDGHNTIFSYDNWEPGYTDVKYIKLVNAGELALNYKLSLTPQNGVGELAKVINVYFAEGGVNVTQRSDLKKLKVIGLLNNVLNGGATADGTFLAADQSSPLHPSGEVIMTVAMNMLTTAGNEYQSEDAGLFTITALATQASFEQDSFGSDYDTEAKFPTILTGGSASATVTPSEGKVSAGGVTLNGGNVSAFVPEGVALENGVTELTLTVTPLKNTTSDITVVNDEILIPVDVHIEGVADTNDVPIIVDLGEVLPKYLNIGNYRLFHVEDGINHEMTLVAGKAALSAHNQFTYDSDTGAVSVAMATFSEVALVADTKNAWQGGTDDTWYDENATELTITNGDQLDSFSKMVGKGNDFAGKTIKLIADINLNDKIFYPIGYYNNQDIYNRDAATTIEGSVESNVNSFSGTFNGNGHTISNFYQNTWEMFGDYNSGYSGTPNYYKDAMGLFGYVNGGEILNLTVDSFESDGEFTPTGVIAAYAVDSDFKNIAITNCNPRVYNTGNGGIVGVGGNSSDGTDVALNFTNITVDNTNTITALWGSWDVACGGIMGMFRGKGKVNFDNCHVAAKIDVYNDVCGNYQYYWYRYAGMMIGTNYNMTEEDGYTVPDMTSITATKCTVSFDEWNDYYYCELVDNSIASYTHDHQFSRLTQVAAVDVTNKTYTPVGGTAVAIPTEGKYNYVVLDGEGYETENATCYHFVNGALWTHDMAGLEDFDVNGDGELNDRKEDHAHIYLPFNQLFTGYGWGVKHIPISGDEGSNLKDQGYENLDIQILNRDSEEKFKSKFTGDFLYRVGNKNSIAIGSLFEAISESISVSGVWVAIEKLDEDMNVSGTFTQSTTGNWEDGTIKFEGTGVVTITIQDYNYCTPTKLTVEVVDAMNATTATNATANNVVLLNDISGTFTVSNNCTVYGNDFTVTLPSNTYQSKYSSGYVGYITMSGGNLDNVRVEGPVYPQMNIFRDQARDTSDETKANYFYNSILINSGNCTISNSYISGSRSAICIRGGNNVVIEDSTIYGGAVANIHIASASMVTLRDLTTIQIDATDSYGQNKTVHGMGVYVEAGSTQLNIEGTLNQYNWINETQWNAMVGTYKNQFPKFFTDTEYEAYQHNYNGTTYVNLALIFACDWDVDVFNTDNHTNQNEYLRKSGITLLGYTGGIYATANKGDLTEELVNYTLDHISFGYKPIAPVFDFDNTVNYDADDESDSADTYCVYDEDAGVLKIGIKETTKTLNLNGVQISKAGTVLTHTAYLNGNKIDGTTVTIDKENGTTQYLRFVAASNDAGYDASGNPIVGSITYEWIVKIELAVLAYANPEWTMSDLSNGTYQINAKDGNCIWVEYGSMFDKNYGEALPIFGGITVKYYDATGEHTVDFSSIANTTGLTADGTTANVMTYTDPTTGCKLEIKYSSGWKGNSPNYLVNVYNNTVYVYPKDLSNSSYVRDNKQTFDAKFTYTFIDPNGQSTDTITVNWYDATTYNDITSVQWKTFDSTNGKDNTTCVTPDTLVTLADGSKKQIQHITFGEKVKVWNFETGEYVIVPVSLIQAHSTGNMNVLRLRFEDGTAIKILGEHGLFDATQNTFVFIDECDVQEYLGHDFVKQDGASYKTVKLVDYEVYEEYTTAYTILSMTHYNVLLEDMLTVTPAHVGDNFFNPFEIFTGMKYDKEAMQTDIETYGLFTYEEFSHVLTEEQFNALNIAQFKVSVGKGLVTYDGLVYLIKNFVNNEDFNK